MKKNKRIYAIIMLLFFVLGLAVSFGYCSFKMEETKMFLLLNAGNDSQRILSSMDMNVRSSTYPRDYLVKHNLFTAISSLQNKNIFVHTDYFDSYNYCAVSYSSDNEDSFVAGYIEYDGFLRSMTIEQYNSIKNYLNSKPEQGECYSIVCREFYVNNYQIFPKKIEVVIPDTFQNYAMSYVVEEFELLPDFSNENTLYKNDNLNFDEIPADFILGKYDCFDLMEKTIQGYNYDDEIEVDISGNIIYGRKLKEVNIAPFTYGVELYQGAIYFDSGYDDYVQIACAARFNVLDYCFGDIILVSSYTIALFLFVGIILCIVVYLNMQKQLEQEQNLLTITNSLVHNLKTPLFIISGNAENLSEISQEPKEKECGLAIVKQVGVMDERINKMFELLRMETTDYKLKFEEFNITEVVAEIIDGYKNCEKQIEFSCDENQIVYADKRMMYSVIETLLDNAVLYGVDDTVKVNFENYVLSVSNLSENIKKKDLKKFVKPYYRHSDNGKKSGNGVGLAIAKNILKLHKTKFNFKIHNDIITVSFKINKT